MRAPVGKVGAVVGNANLALSIWMGWLDENQYLGSIHSVDAPSFVRAKGQGRTTDIHIVGGVGTGTRRTSCVGIVWQAEYFALSVIEFCAAFLTFLSLRSA